MLAELLDLIPTGVEEREVDAATVEYVLYGAPGELPALGRVRAAAGGALVDVSSSELPDDWSERWRSFHAAPIAIGTTSSLLPSVGMESTLAGWESTLHSLASAAAVTCAIM